MIYRGIPELYLCPRIAFYLILDRAQVEFKQFSRIPTQTKLHVALKTHYFIICLSKEGQF